MPDSFASSDEAAPATSWAPVAIVTGALWAAFALRGAFSLRDLFVLSCGGALSLWLSLVALGELRQRPRLLGALLPAFGSSLLVLTLAGRWLIDATHHRPLGAVTFSFAAAFVCALSFALFWQRRLPLLWGALLAACSLVWVVVVLLPYGAALLEPLVGLALVGVLFFLNARVRVKSRGLALGSAAALGSACVIAVWLGSGATAHPVVLGLPGLLR